MSTLLLPELLSDYEYKYDVVNSIIWLYHHYLQKPSNFFQLNEQYELQDPYE